MVIYVCVLNDYIWSVKDSLIDSFSPGAECLAQRHNDDSSLLNIKPATIHHPDHRSWAAVHEFVKFKWNIIHFMIKVVSSC